MQALSAIAFLAGLVLVRAQTLRGVNPDLASYYKGEGGTFTCISGIRKTIPVSRVNDDYCDCPDGSDEPGTSACHNGRFYCRNLGHEPRLLASAFVDDGVCDCCDGTDEAKGKCQNTCLQAAAVRKEELKGKIQLHEVMLNSKKEYVNRASSFKEELKLKSQTVDEDIAKQIAEIENLKGEVSRLEAEEATRQADEAARQAEIAAANQAAEEERKAAAAQQTSTEGHEASSGQGEGAAYEEEQDNGEEEADLEEREETAEERGRRIASQWTNDPEAAAVSEHVSDDEHAGEDDEHYDGGEDEEGHHDYVHNQEEAPPSTEYQSHQVHRPPRPDPTSPLGKARSAVFQAERQLERLRKDKENIGTFLHSPVDLGPDDVFLALANKCFTSYQTRWTYEICMFDKATQKEGYTNSVTVGRWYGFSPDYKTMYFTGGDECWNVGPRTMTVSLYCGWDEKLSDGEEPSTCAYSARLSTPVVCTEAELEELKEQLNNLEAFEKEVQAQILKDEL